MTGQSGGGPVRLLLRAPPHLPFVQGWPGILAGGNRNGATVNGTVEVRVGGTHPVKAKYVHVKVVKYEAISSGTVAKGPSQTSTTYIGKVHVLWKAPDNKEWDVIRNDDFRFVIPLPIDLPPTTEGKGAVIRYELVATVCYKSKSGLFKKDQSSLSSASEPLRIIKHELASAWPTYNTIERRSVQAGNGQVVLTVERPSYAFGPGDRINVTPTLSSHGPPAFRLKGFDMALVEVLTVYPPVPDKNAQKSKKNKEPQLPTVKRNTVNSTRVVVNDIVGAGSEKSARLDLVIPSDRPLLTVRDAALFGIEYELVVEAVCEGLPSKILISDLPCIIGSFSRSSAQQAARDIGYVEGLCPRPPAGGGHHPTASLPGQLHGSPQTSFPGHQSSASYSGLQVPDAYNRPLSIDPRNRPLSLAPSIEPSPSAQQHTPPRQEHAPLAQQNNVPPQMQNKRPPAPGFVPRELWRRSSSGTTTTTTTTTTAQTDFGPAPDRNATTLPTRSSLAFPVPSPNLSMNSKLSESPFMPSREGDAHRDAYGFGEKGDGGHGNSQRLSTATAGTFGVRPSGQIESPTHTRSPSSPSRSNWPSASEEKQRMRYEAARASAAQSQAAHGADLNTIGLGEVPLGAPPDYAQQSSSAHTPRSSSIGSAALHNTALASTPKASPSASPQTDYMSAAEEKEAMRRRYEMAQNRVASAGRSTSHTSSPSLSARHQADDSRSSYEHAAGSSVTPSAPPVAFMSAADEKEQMRRFEEARNKVARKTGVVVPNGSPGASSSGHGHSRSVSQNYPSAAEEKELMRKRYEEAMNRVASSSGAPASLSPAPSSSTPPSSYPSVAEEKDLQRREYEKAQNRVAGSSAPYPSAAEEKEIMRRRYEEAQSRVASSSALSSSASYPSAAEEKDMMRRKFEEAQRRVASNSSNGHANGGSPSRQSASTSPPGPEPRQYPTAAEEKEQMRFAEAQNRVARATSSSPPPATNVFLSSAQEKEQMRLRYEQAQSRVASSSLGRSSSTGHGIVPGQSPPPPDEDPIPYDQLFGAASASGHGHSGSGSGSGSRIGSTSGPSHAPQPAAYMSAEDEKAAMRKRYEDAQQRVARGSSTSPPSSPPSFAAAATASRRGTAPRHSSGPSSSGFMTAQEEKDAERARYEAAQGAVNRAGGGVSSIGYRSRMSSTPLPDGPPPPLPSRPPTEYITRI